MSYQKPDDVADDVIERLFTRNIRPRTKERAGTTGHGEPRGAALQRVLRENTITSEQLDRLRTDSSNFTRKGLQQLMSMRRGRDVNRRELRESALRLLPPGTAGDELRMKSARLLTASSDDPTPLSDEIKLDGDSFGSMHVHSEGDGLGWTLDPGAALGIPFGFMIPFNTDNQKNSGMYFEYDYTAPATRRYLFSVCVCAYGT